jgi:exosome complex component CSL4
MVARVKPINPLALIKVGDIVIGYVTETREKMVVANVKMIEGYNREPSGEKLGTIHVSKISTSYTSDVRKEMRLGDIIRAEVIQVQPSLQLTTADPKLGVIRALCTRCRKTLKKTDRGLYCDNCKRSEQRKLANDYAEPARA